MESPESAPAYVLAPVGWTWQTPNPFSHDEAYEGWSCFEIAQDLDWNFRHGKAENGLFHVRFGPNVDRLEARLAAFLRYEPRHGRRVIVARSAEVDADELVQRALKEHPTGGHQSREELRWLVHSTDLGAWENIQRCGELRSLGRVLREGLSVDPLGQRVLHEPEDYAEYVMLGSPGYIGGEHVVASRKRGEIFTEENTPYTPGVRIYLDGYKIMDDGLAVYDGLHAIKVHDHLPLEPYFIMAVTVKTLDPGAQVSEWTPRKFLDAADTHFREFLGRGQTQ